jgi:glycine/D-amino acid oxidase-like deaminating enzyme
MTVTERRDLWSGDPLWRGDLPGRIGAPLLRDTVCDVLIIGGGISGACIAEALASPHRSVALLERRGIAHGSTAASTALLEWDLDMPLGKLQRQIGAERAERAWRRAAESFGAVGALIRRYDIDCDYRSRDGLYLCGNSLDAAALRDEAAYRAKLGLACRFIDAQTLRGAFGIERDGAILSRGSAEVNPVKLAAGIIRAAVRCGARIYEPEEASMIELGDSILVETARGRTIRAKYVIFASGYEVPKMVPRGGFRFVTTWAIATRRQAGVPWRDRVLISEAAQPYFYLRTTPDDRVLAGGEDEECGNDDAHAILRAQKSATLAAKLNRLLPWLDTEIEHCWGALFAVTDTSLPMIGAIPGMPNCFAVLGFGGNGITYSLIAAQLIGAEIDGGRDPDADLFALTNIPAGAGAGNQ